MIAFLATIFSIFVLTVLAGGVPPASAAASPPLSEEASAAEVDSAYGSGSFGTWAVDRFGLPAYRYEIDEETAPQAAQPELGGKTDAWHQVGNDHLVANAYNHGYVQLWSQDRLYQWMNFYDPSRRHYAGGYGYLNAGGKTVSTLYDDRPDGAETERDFGVGYFRRKTVTGGLSIEEFIYAPFGDDPVLLHDVTVTNTSSEPLDASWFEYWDVNPEVQALAQIPRGYQSPAYDPSSRTLMVAELPQDVDTDPLTIFAAALDAPVADYDTDTNAFFGSGSRAAPAAVAGGALGNSIAPPAPAGVTGRAMFAFRSPVSLAPGESVTLRYAYGFAHPEAIAGLVDRYRSKADPLAESESRWAAWLPNVSLGSSYAWLSRELVWDAYMVRSGATYEEICGHHILSQGGYYQYYFSFQGAFRDPLQHVLPMIWADGPLSREVLAYSAQEQPATIGAIPYAHLSACRRYDLGTSDDLDLWLLWATSEYVLSTRDFGFLDTEIPYATVGSASLLDHLKLAFRHLETVVGRGPHGEYLTGPSGSTGDWSDFSTEFLQMTESNLVTAQAAYIYPRMALVAEAVGDEAFAAELRAAAARNLDVVKREYVPNGWFARGYSGARQIGAGSIWEEPQPWGLLAGAASAEQAERTVAAYRRFLAGVGAPKGPSKIGSAIAPSSNDPDASEQSEPPVNGSTEWPGGAWYAVNGWMTWALADLDGTVPDAASYAWDELLRNTLATHATAFPDHWDGVISVDDVCNGYYTATPENCGIGLTTEYNTQILHQPAYGLFDFLKLVGIETTATGYRIVPHLPMTTFRVQLPRIGLAQTSDVIRGYVRTAGGTVTMEVAPPPGVAASEAVAWVDGAVVPHQVDGSLVRFEMPTSPDEPADWSVGVGN